MKSLMATDISMSRKASYEHWERPKYGSIDVDGIYRGNDDGRTDPRVPPPKVVVLIMLPPDRVAVATAILFATHQFLSVTQSQIKGLKGRHFNDLFSVM
jgi:hypothetical protein